MSRFRYTGKKAKPGKIKLNKAEIENVLQQVDAAYAEVVTELDLEYEAVIEDPNEFADQGFINQDIVDTGRFRDGQKVEVRDRKASWTWDPVDPKTGFHYATALYTGFKAYGNENRYIPGRHWPERAIKRIDPVRSLSKKLRARGINAKVISNNANQLQ